MFARKRRSSRSDHIGLYGCRHSQIIANRLSFEPVIFLTAVSVQLDTLFRLVRWATVFSLFTARWLGDPPRLKSYYKSDNLGPLGFHELLVASRALRPIQLQGAPPLLNPYYKIDNFEAWGFWGSWELPGPSGKSSSRVPSRY